MIACGFCGRENEELSRFCEDCGKPIVSGGARVIAVAGLANARRPAESEAGMAEARSAAPATHKGGAVKQCPSCASLIDPEFPFCPRCGTRLDASVPEPPRPGADGTPAGGAAVAGTGPKLAVLGEAGDVVQTISLDKSDATFGRGETDVRFVGDVFLSPVHAQLSRRNGQLFVRDLGSRNGTWLFIDGPYRLQDGDTILVGSQLLRFRRLGYPSPHPPEADHTRRLGSLTPSADIAVIAQLRADGSARDSYHLSPGRNVKIGRDGGDWVFPYDQTMSSKHAEIRSEDLEFVVRDDGSRNGIAVSVRGEKPLVAGQRFLIGDQTIRVESV